MKIFTPGTALITGARSGIGASQQKPLKSGFGAKTTAREVLARIDLTSAPDFQVNGNVRLLPDHININTQHL